MDKNFKLSSREFAKSIGITLECLYSRIRRGQYRGLYISEKNLLWFKKVRPFMNDQITNDNSSLVTSYPIPDPRRSNTNPRCSIRPKISVSRDRRRGVHATGKKTKYPNYAFEKHNEIKMLARLKGKVSEEVINEIVPETIKLAQEKIWQEKQRRFHESIKPIRNYGSGIYNAKTAKPKYKAIGEPIRRDDDTRNWVHDLPGKPKTYY
jgi:hypothetical protein